MINLAITFLASFLIWLMFAGLLVLWVIDGKIKKEQVIHALLASISAWLIAELIKSLIPTARPFLLNGHPVETLTLPHDSAFPSAHSALAFSLAVTIWLHNRKVGWLYLISACVVGMARILANVHYPVDILGGAFVGVITSLVIEKLHLFNLLKKFKMKT
jgi:undecaprenyl-diphosphatase